MLWSIPLGPLYNHLCSRLGPAWPWKSNTSSLSKVVWLDTTRTYLILAWIIALDIDETLAVYNLPCCDEICRNLFGAVDTAVDRVQLLINGGYQQLSFTRRTMYGIWK